ncbi:hypothetical protein DM860_014415 [Cuscuta australis]|uniref:Uncharacterized protein n=1 Tax=Cuscuta australis TaxID=267555 RepID=A0A328DTV3_9ASTE|nr:hypothetical protein DM860_014415 [Cuscuta australis]
MVCVEGSSGLLEWLSFALWSRTAPFVMLYYLWQWLLSMVGQYLLQIGFAFWLTFCGIGHAVSSLFCFSTLLLYWSCPTLVALVARTLLWPWSSLVLGSFLSLIVFPRRFVFHMRSWR